LRQGRIGFTSKTPGSTTMTEQYSGFKKPVFFKKPNPLGFKKTRLKKAQPTGFFKERFLT